MGTVGCEAFVEIICLVLQGHYNTAVGVAAKTEATVANVGVAFVRLAGSVEVIRFQKRLLDVVAHLSGTAFIRM